MRIGIKPYLPIIILSIAILLILLFVVRMLQGFRNKRELWNTRSCGVQLSELTISDVWLSPEWYVAEKNQPRTKRDHGVDIETVYFLPTSQIQGSIYQEVIKFPDAYRAWYLFRDVPNFPDSGWVAYEANQINIVNGADQWATGCIKSNHGSIDCAMIARYTDVVIIIEGRFNAEDFSQDSFFELTKKIDLIATEKISVCE